MDPATNTREEDVEYWKAALDDVTFAKISDSDLGYPTHGTTSSMGLETTQRQEQEATARPRHPTQRFKRKNFSKQLQLLCLQRYAQYTRDFGHLPNKHETQQLLQQSFVQFLKEGGAADEPKLTYAEFLKLIRNRRREIHARAKQSPNQKKQNHVTSKAFAALTPAKRKLQEEHAKIREFIEIIDKAREQTGLTTDPQVQQQRRVWKPKATQQHSTMGMAQVPSSSLMIESLQPLPPDPMEQMDAILRIHQETREIQREIVTRLRSISHVLSQHESHGELDEPSSASV